MDYMGRRSFCSSLDKRYEECLEKIRSEEKHDNEKIYPKDFRCNLNKRAYHVPKVDVPPTPTMSEEDSEEEADDSEANVGPPSK